MRILISGSTGLVGTAATQAFEREGHVVCPLVRPQSRSGGRAPDAGNAVRWDPVAGEFDAAAAEGADVLVHLAGASIAHGRWNAERKRLLGTSRIDATRQLMTGLSKLQRPPRIVVAASAIGYYGTRGDETLTEASAPGDTFLARLCLEWESENARAAEFGARVAILRFGVVLDPHGGALPSMALPFKLGAGGRVGSGQQWLSWVTLPELVNMIGFAIANSQIAGPFNAVAPNPVRNSEFTQVLAKTLHRPALFPAPAFALRLALGEMADALLLASQRVIPERLQRSGYTFIDPNLGPALHKLFL